MSTLCFLAEKAARLLGPGTRRLLWLALFLHPALLGGCAAVSNPVADGIPVRRLPPEVFAQSKADEQLVPLTALRQPPPDVYRLAPGDVLGVWIEGVLGERNAAPPVRMPEASAASSQANLTPSLGFPIPVRDDGTLPLPLIEPVKVEGMSLTEAEAAIIKAYTVTKKIIQPGRERIIVTLMQPRRYHVLVVRSDAGSVTFGATGGFGGLNNGTSISETQRSSGFQLDLPAYENDLMNALTRTGGLPGPEAEKEVIIQRGANKQETNTQGPTAKEDPLHLHDPVCPPSSEGKARGESEGEIIRIPLRVRPGEQPSFRPSDIILHNGDVVSVRLRRGELFYTGGLLPTRAFPLPFGRDLDVIEAMGFVGGPLINGGFTSGIAGGNLANQGIGNPNPSMLTVIRRTPGCGQIAINVNLNRALRDPRERILVQAGDVLILQSTMCEALTQYFNNQFNLNLFGTIIRQRDLTGTATLNVP